jgi:hypothetical protein
MAGSSEPTKIAVSQLRRQAALPRLPRYSNAADDQRHQDQQQGQVEGAEHGRVPAGERRERGAARGQQPDLVAVPDRPDGVDHDPAAGLVPAEHGQQDADAEVEAFQYEVAGP